MGAFDGQKYLSLESFRRNGVGVRTAVWFAQAPGETTLFVYTLEGSGKAKRIRRDGRVRIAPCDAKGRVKGNWVEARAELVEGDGFARGMRLLDRKYWPLKWLLDVGMRLRRGHRRVMIAVRPDQPVGA
jgi:PPOX class probable F420-dependent enzyme